MDTDVQVQAVDEWLTLSDAATVAGTSRATLDRIAAAGEIAFATVGGFRFFHVRDLRQLRAERREK